ncbi:MAG: hypothetical protein H6563_02550 [Lewinellaceae bacterium]|nr:hypothetical protein [Lewinellaceae bacterium]
MKTRNSFDPEKLSLLRVDVVSGAIDNPLEIKYEDVKQTKVELGFSAGFNLEQKKAKVELEIRVSTTFEKEPQAHGRFRIAYLFGVDNLEELVEIKKDKSIQVSENLGLALANISYSTARGILFSRFQATAFRNFILPIISPKAILESGMEESAPE